MRNISVKLFELGPVVKKETSLKDIAILALYAFLFSRAE